VLATSLRDALSHPIFPVIPLLLGHFGSSAHYLPRTRTPRGANERFENASCARDHARDSNLHESLSQQVARNSAAPALLQQRAERRL
jgi:hypothetical protein